MIKSLWFRPMKRTMVFDQKSNKEIEYTIIGIGDDCEKLVEDFKYVFDDILKLGETVKWNNDKNILCDKKDPYICCTYNRDVAAKLLSAGGMVYRKDYLFAEDCFSLLDDWKKSRIAYMAYPGSLKGWAKAIVFGYAAKHGKILPQDKHKAVFRGSYKNAGEDGHSAGRSVKRLYYAFYLLMGTLGSIPQIFAKKNLYAKYDHICFHAISDAIRFKKDHPGIADKVITIDELKAHTMASWYMKAVYFDRRQDRCACTTPFHTLWIGDNGMTRLCDCPEFLDIGCGNAGATDSIKIWKSPLARIIRLSVINNTYTFCSRELCGKLSSDPDRTVLLPRMTEAKEKDHPETIIVGNDSICNLHCPSCRKNLNIKNDENKETEIEACTDALFQAGWLDAAERLIVGAGGEAFLSKYYKQILYDAKVKRNSIVIMTNGTMFTQREWEKLEGKYEHIEFSVSVDAATKTTYESVRCGGRFERLMENMAFLSELRKSGKVDCVKVNMIVQRANYKEIPDFIRWAKKMGFDGVNLSHIRNWGTFTDSEFEDVVSMFDKAGKMEPELAKVLEDPICLDPIVFTSWKN